MSAAPLNSVPGTGPATSSLKTGEALIRGRILGSRKISTDQGKVFLTLIAQPAADEYTRPQVIEVRSSDRLGVTGDTVHAKVRIGGYRRPYKSTDKETGEQVTVVTAQITLDVVE